MVYVAFLTLAFILGVVDTRNCGIFGQRICKYDDYEHVVSKSNWGTLLFTYNLGVGFGYFMNGPEIGE
jgi:hypothetical protein